MITSFQSMAFVLAVSSGLSAVCFAQDKFPDVPANHWAYESIDQLRSLGLLKGYPDHTFRGPRSFTRYEMAVLIHDAWLNLKKRQDGLVSKISELDAKVSQGEDVGAKDLNEVIEGLRSGLKSVQAMGPEIKSLYKLWQSFEPELTQIGIRYEEEMRSLDGLRQRIEKLEKQKLPVRISGETNFVFAGGYSSKGDYGVDLTGRPLGTGRGGQALQPVGLFHSFMQLHELALTLQSQEDAQVPFKATIVSGNMVGFASKAAAGNGFSFGGYTSQSSASTGVAYGEAKEALYLQELSADLGRKNIVTKVGRIGVQSDPYLLRRPDKTPYFKNDRWDNGDFMMDGALLTARSAGAKLRFFAGRTNQNTTTTGEPVQTISYGRTSFLAVPGQTRPLGTLPGAINVDQMFGADATFGQGRTTGSLSAIQFYSNTSDPTGTVNNGLGYAASVQTQLPAAKLSAGYAKANLSNNNTQVIKSNNDAYWFNASLDKGPVSASLGYQFIKPLFYGSGDWGIIGLWRNPTDVKGFNARASWRLKNNWTLAGLAQFLNGTGTQVNGATGLSTSDKIRQMKGTVSKRLNEDWEVSASYDSVLWDLQSRTGFTGGKPEERWTSLGLKRLSGGGRVFSVLWQISDYNSKGVAGYALPTNGALSATNGVRARGGLLTMQFSVPF